MLKSVHPQTSTREFTVRPDLAVASLPPTIRPLNAKNEAEVCDVLIAALSQMLKDREGAPLTDTSTSCNGPVVGEEKATSSSSRSSTPAGQGEVSRGEVEGEERGAERCIMPEDRQRAVELLREGEASVLRFCLSWVEVSRRW